MTNLRQEEGMGFPEDVNKYYTDNKPVEKSFKQVNTPPIADQREPRHD